MTKTADHDVDTTQLPGEPQREGIARALVRMAASRQHLLWLGAILLLALALRLAWIGYAHPNPNDGRFDDTLFYDHAAQALAAGKGFLGFFDAQTAGWPPGYPLLLAGIFKAFGHGFFLPRLLNVFAGVATCLLVYLIGARVFDRKTGVVGALLLAVLPSHIYRTTLLMTEVLTGAVVALLAYLLLTWVLKKGGPSRLQAIALGVFFGAFALMRGEALVAGAGRAHRLEARRAVVATPRRRRGVDAVGDGAGDRALDGTQRDNDARVHTGRQRPRAHVPRRSSERSLRAVERLPRSEDHREILLFAVP